MFMYIVFLFTISLLTQPFVVLVSRVKCLSHNRRANAFLEFAECHVSCLMGRHERYVIWPQVMLIAVSLCVYDRHGENLCRNVAAFLVSKVPVEHSLSAQHLRQQLLEELK